MRPMAVVVVDVLVDDGFEMATTEDEYSIQTFTTDGSYKPFSEGVGSRCPDRRPKDPDALGAEDLIESGRELGVCDPG